MSQDYYEILQVHPRADQDAIAAAYTRLRDLYDSKQLEDVADVFAEMAREKRDAIERAYAVLGDPTRRASYDAEQAALRGTEDRGSKIEDRRSRHNDPSSSNS